MLLRMWDQDEKKLNKTFLQKPKALPESGDEKEEEATTGEEQIGARSRTEQSGSAGEEKALVRWNFVHPNVVVVDDGN